MSINHLKNDQIGKFLQLIVLTTHEGISYEFFGTPIDIQRFESNIKGIMLGPVIEKEGAIEYLRSGSKYLFEGMDGEGAWRVEGGGGFADHGSKD
jgi:hypothetical protein